MMKKTKTPKKFEFKAGLYRSFAIAIGSKTACPVEVKDAVIDALESDYSGEIERLKDTVKKLLEFTSNLVFILNNKTVIGPTGYILHILEDKEVASLLPGYTWVDGPIDDEDE